MMDAPSGAVVVSRRQPAIDVRRCAARRRTVVDPPKGGGPGCAESESPLHQGKPPIDDLKTEWIAATHVANQSEEPHSAAQLA